MLHLRNINPMVRAVGTMGAVSALVGGITFAQLTSNTVALSPNTLSTGTANLEIGTSRSRDVSSDTSGTNGNTGNTNNTSSSDTTGTGTTTQNNSTVNSNVGTLNNNSTTDNNNRNSSCRNTTNGTIPGFNLTGQNGLLPGVTSRPLQFCLNNTSNVPLDLTAAIADDPFTNTTGLTAADVTLDINCDNGGHANGTLDEFVTSNTTTAETLGSLAANRSTNCRATVELSNSATISGTESLPSFDIEFTGTTSS